MDFFSSSDVEASGVTIEYPSVDEYSAQRLLAMEKEAFGVSLSANLLNDYSDSIGQFPGRVMLSSLLLPSDGGSFPEKESSSQVTVCALVTDCTEKQTRSGAVMTFLKVEDESGECDVVVFPQQRERFRDVLNVENVLKLTGKVSYSEIDPPKFILSSAVLLKKNEEFKEHYVSQIIDSISENSPKESNSTKSEHSKLFVRFDMSDESLKKRVINLISIFNDGNDYALFYDTSRNDYDRYTTLKCSISVFLVKEIEELVGKGNVIVK